jgi:hypothetical protein
MRMRRLISLAIAAVLALTVAGIAIAHSGGGQPAKTEAAQATFTATPDAAKTRTTQCTGVDGTYNITKGVYNGTATGDPRLTGNITIRTKSVVNQGNGLGWTAGQVFLRDPATGELKAIAGLEAVNTERGKLDGFLTGKVKDPTAPAGTKLRGGGHHGNGRNGNALNLAANFTAAFNADGTQLTGELGSGTGQNSAIFFGNPCASQGTAQGQAENNNGSNNGNQGDGRKGGRGGH